MTQTPDLNVMNTRIFALESRLTIAFRQMQEIDQELLVLRTAIEDVIRWRNTLSQQIIDLISDSVSTKTSVLNDKNTAIEPDEPSGPS